MDEIINLVRKVFKSFFDLKEELFDTEIIEINLQYKYEEFGNKYSKELHLFQQLFVQPNYFNLLKEIFYLELEEKNQKLLSAIKFEKEDLRKGNINFYFNYNSI